MNGTHKIQHRNKLAVIFSLLFSFFPVSFGQTDLKTLLKLAESNYPVIAARQATAEAARIDVSLEKNTLMPSLDAAFQANYATYNNITGMSYPGMLMPISGPPTSSNMTNAVPGSAAGLLLKWSPLTFGKRPASIEYDRKIYEKQLALVEDEVLKVKFRVAFVYLDIAITKELIKAFKKNTERNEFNLSQVTSLVAAGLRPAVDSLKFKGELSKSKSELYKLENLLETQIQELQELIPSEKIQDIEKNEFFVQMLPDVPASASVLEPYANPLLKISKFEMEAEQSRLKQINRSWTPKLEFWGTAYARGSGISYNGTVNNADAWTFNRQNYGIGLQLIFPIADVTNLRLKTNRQKALLLSSEKYLYQTQITLNKQEIIASGDLNTSLLIAREAPVEYQAGESAFNALQTLYNAGLTDYAELIRSQYDLLNADAGLKNAYVSTWKSLLKLAVIRGDMSIFINQIQN
jgi:outer membrane protein